MIKFPDPGHIFLFPGLLFPRQCLKEHYYPVGSVKYHYIPTRMAKIIKANTTKGEDLELQKLSYTAHRNIN